MYIKWASPMKALKFKGDMVARESAHLRTPNGQTSTFTNQQQRSPKSIDQFDSAHGPQIDNRALQNHLFKHQIPGSARTSKDHANLHSYAFLPISGEALFGRCSRETNKENHKFGDQERHLAWHAQKGDTPYPRPTSPPATWRPGGGRQGPGPADSPPPLGGGIRMFHAASRKFDIGGLRKAA